MQKNSIPTFQGKELNSTMPWEKITHDHVKQRELHLRSQNKLLHYYSQNKIFLAILRKRITLNYYRKQKKIFYYYKMQKKNWLKIKKDKVMQTRYF